MSLDIPRTRIMSLAINEYSKGMHKRPRLYII